MLSLSCPRCCQSFLLSKGSVEMRSPRGDGGQNRSQQSHPGAGTELGWLRERPAVQVMDGQRLRAPSCLLVVLGTGWWCAGGPQKVASGPWLPKLLLRRGRAGSEALGEGGGEWLEDKGPLSQAPPHGAGCCQPWEWDQLWGSCLWWCRTHPLLTSMLGMPLSWRQEAPTPAGDQDKH